MSSTVVATASANRGNPAAVPILLVLLFAVVHLLLLDTPTVNLEYAFSDAAKYFSTGDSRYLVQYFESEANTLAIPWLAFAIQWLIPWLSIDHVPRLLSDLGVPLLAFGLLRLNRTLSGKINSSLLISIVLLNPLIWTFAGRGTADFLPAALAVFAISLFWDGDEKTDQGIWRCLLASAVLGLAAVLKYHALLLLSGVIAGIAIRRRTQYGRIILECAAVAIPAILIIGVYLLIVRINFGFWITPPAFQRQLGLNLAAGPDNFLSYVGYLVLITLPLSFAVQWRWLSEDRLRWVAVLSGLAAAFTAGYFFLSDNGEMNLGPLDSYVDKHIANGVLGMLSVVFATCLFAAFDRLFLSAKRSTCLIAIVTSIIFFMLALSLSRPAQRYLLYIVPLFYFIILLSTRHHRAMFAPAILLSIVLDVYILLNQVATGVASEEMARQIVERGLLSKTDPGPIVGNVGNLFFPYRNEGKTFAVVPGEVEGRMVGVHYSVFPHLPFIGKSYSLVRLKTSHAL
jgi:hypothetical protein